MRTDDIIAGEGGCDDADQRGFRRGVFSRLIKLAHCCGTQLCNTAEIPVAIPRGGPIAPIIAPHSTPH